MPMGTVSPEELEIADWVAGLVEQHLGEIPGEPTEQNGCIDPKLTVDWTFDQASPPFALEITRVTPHFEGAQDADVERFSKHVSGEARRLGAPHWRIGVQPESKLAGDLLSSLTTLMSVMLALNLERLSPGMYSFDIPLDLRHGWTRAFTKLVNAPALTDYFRCNGRRKVAFS